MSDDVTLTVNGRAWSGWQEVTITRGVERCPADFELALTELYPGQSQQMDIQPGQTCTVDIGGDIVITGFIDRYAASISPADHSVRIQGRSKCLDLVDCSAVVSTGEINQTTVLDLTQQLCAPYGITAKQISGLNFPVGQFNVNLTETPYEIIERVARYAALLAYDDADGNIVLATVGATSMASGFSQGINVQAAAVTLSMDDRFHTIVAVPMGQDSLSDVSQAENYSMVASSPTAVDPTVRSIRTRIIVSEQIANGQDIAQQRANWEVARRYGRSQMVQLTCDSWRDSAGKLWTPNSLAPVNIPTLKLVNANWVIGEVSFRRSIQDGTIALLTLMPKEAYQPEPEILYAFDYQVWTALHPNSAPSAGSINT